MPHKQVRMYRCYDAADLRSPEAKARREAAWKLEDEKADQQMEMTIAALAARGVEIDIAEPFGETLLTIRIDGVEVGEIW